MTQGSKSGNDRLDIRSIIRTLIPTLFDEFTDG